MKVTITNPEIASLAGEWCNEKFGNEGWDIWMQDMFTREPKYKFEFFTEKDATMFMLRWGEFV